MNMLVYCENGNLTIRKPNGLEYTFENTDRPELGFDFDVLVYDDIEVKILKWDETKKFDNQEKINLVDSEIDAIETDNSLDQLSFQFTLEQSGTFNEGIELESGDGNIEQETATGGTDNMICEDETGGESIVLETGDYIIQEAFVVDTIDENAMNDFFETQDDNIIDFTESNPFGDIGQ